MTTFRDYTADEIGRRGEDIYQRLIRPVVEPDNRGRDVVVDIETGQWELGDDVEELTERLHAKHPEAALYHVRVGSPYTARIGGRLKAGPA